MDSFCPEISLGSHQDLTTKARVFKLLYLHSKKCWVVLTQFWVKYGQTQNAGLKM